MGRGPGPAGPASSSFDDIQALRSQFCHESATCHTYSCLIRSSGERRALSEGLLLHSRIILDGFRQHELSLLQNLLIQMYGRCGAMEDAFCTFSNIRETDHFSWNLLLGACSENDQSAKAVYVFSQMQTEGFLPNKHALLAICAVQVSTWDCKATHTRINVSNYASDAVLGSAIVHMYGKCSSAKDAFKFFANMLERTELSWNAMMSTYAQHGEGDDALRFFLEMLQNEIAPSRVTFLNLLNACTSLRSADTTKLLHFCVMDRGFESDVAVGTTIAKAYGEYGLWEETLKVFSKLPSKGTVTWNMMIEVSASHCPGRRAFLLFQAMLEAGVEANSRTFVSILSACVNEENLVAGRLVHFIVISNGTAFDLILETALISMYGKCRSLEDAQAVFSRMSTHDSVAWKTIIAAYVQLGQEREALSLIEKMPPETSFYSYTFISMFETCAADGSLEIGRRLHTFLLESESPLDLAIGTAVVNMYGKCGELEDAQGAFQNLSQPDGVAWNAMIAAYSQSSHFEAIMDLLWRMLCQSIALNDVTFQLISTCLSHGGRVSDVVFCLQSMKASHAILPGIRHFNTLLNVFGQAGWIDETKMLVSRVPFQPTLISWMTLLGTCWLHLNVPGLEWVAKHANEIEPDSIAAHRVLSNCLHRSQSV